MKCENCEKTIWPWQKRLKVKWYTGDHDFSFSIEAVYHKYQCVKRKLDSANRTIKKTTKEEKP